MGLRTGTRLAGFTLALALAGCGDAGDDMGDDGTSGDGELSFAADIQPILDDNCVSNCHSAGGLAEFLPLGDGYDQLVGVDSSQSSMKLVAAGSSADSYVVAKLRGTQIDVGGQGGPMPGGGGDLLDEATISLIEEWIDAGAAP